VAAPREQQRKHVAGVVAGIGHQRHRVRQHAIKDLYDDQSDIQRRSDRKRSPERIRCVAMPMSVTMSMTLPVVMTVLMAMIVFMFVMRRHASY
jgi:hypothetical protein